MICGIRDARSLRLLELLWSKPTKEIVALIFNNLGKWIIRQRPNKDKLSPERIERLDSIGVFWCTRAN